MELKPSVSGAGAYIQAFDHAFHSLQKNQPELLPQYIEQLKSERLHISNHLLFALYGTNPCTYADEAITLVERDTERASLGDQTVQSVVRACSENCNQTLFEKLERRYIDFFSSEDMLYADEGLHHYLLDALRTLDQSRLQPTTLTLMEKWQSDIDEKYPKVRKPEEIIHDSFFGGEQIDLTDGEWMELFAKEQSDFIARNRVFQKTVISNPRHYIQLVEKHHPVASTMVEGLLYAIHEADISREEKYELARFTMQYKERDCQHAFIRLIESLNPFDFDKDVIEYIADIATHSTSEIEESWKHENGCYYGGDLLTCGMNTPRGSAIWFFYHRLYDDPEQFESIVLDVIDKLVAIESDSIQANVFLLLTALSNDHKDCVLKLAEKMLKHVSVHVLATDTCKDLLTYLLWHEPNIAIPVIHQLLVTYEQCFVDENKKMKCRQSCGELAMLARFYHDTPSARSLLDKAFQGSQDTRQGIAFYACEALKFHEHQLLAVDILKKLFNDYEDTVWKYAANCFRNLLELDEISAPIKDLIGSFIDSPAFSVEFAEFFRFLSEYKIPMIADSMGKYQRPLTDGVSATVDRFLLKFVIYR